VVVLPFDDMSEGGDYAYFAAGLSEELTSVLAGLPGLRVIGRTSAEAVKRRGIGVGEIGSELGVGAVVEGSVRRADGRLRVTVQLIETEDGFHIWTDSYDRPIGDVFRVQSEIASDISAAMDPRLKAARTIPPTANVGAYDAYLTGRHMVGRQTPADMRRAIERFEESIRQDPEFSLAYSGLADALVLSWTLGFDDAESVVPRAREAARRAVATGPDSAEAHTSMGRIQWMDRDWEASEASLRRAISLRPGYAFAHSNLALVLINRGRFEEGLAASRRAVDLEPLSPFMHVNLAMNQASARQHEDAIRSARRTGALQPNNAIATGIASISLAHLGRTAESAEEILGSGLPAEIEARLRAAYEAEGITGFRRAYLKLQTARSDDPCGGSGGVVLYALLGDHDIVIDCLAAGIHRPGAYVNLHLAHNQAFDLVRDAPRFQAILHEAGLAATE
jgi:TolB-like protein/tetratricopeptide (TPR) repeat protein